MTKIARESEESLYTLCGRQNWTRCFGILYQGKLQRKGFESIVRPKPDKAVGDKILKKILLVILIILLKIRSLYYLKLQEE